MAVIAIVEPGLPSGSLTIRMFSSKVPPSSPGM